MLIIQEILYLFITYFIAAIPFGLVLTKIFAKKDVRKFGSKNIGATNVARVAGKKLALTTLILDGCKGAIMVIIARFYFVQADNLNIFLVFIALVAIIAHIYPIYLKFKGGKGVATALATLLAIDFSVGLLAICFWILTFSFCRISAIASLVAISSTIFSSIYYRSPLEQILFSITISIIITIRHKDNIIRIITGEENKFENK